MKCFQQVIPACRKMFLSFLLRQIQSVSRRKASPIFQNLGSRFDSAFDELSLLGSLRTLPMKFARGRFQALANRELSFMSENLGKSFERPKLPLTRKSR